MVLFKRKPVQYVPNPPLHDDQEVWSIEETNEVFTTYEDYLHRYDFYKQKRFSCEVTGHSQLNFYDALRSEMEASDEVDDAFPYPLREPILRKVQFSVISRIDNLVDRVFEDFKHDFYPGETVTVILDNGERHSGTIREKTRFPDVIGADGSLEPKTFPRYFVSLSNRPRDEAIVDEDHIVRDRKTFTKQRLRSFIKGAVQREAWQGAPWLVKTKIANQYHINCDVPEHLSQEFQVIQRRAALSGKRGEHGSSILEFYHANHQLPPLKPKGSKGKDRQFMEYQYALAADPGLAHFSPMPNQPHYHRFVAENPFMATNGFPPIVAKSQPKPPPPPQPQIKYPIEDLELPPIHDAPHRPTFLYLNQDITNQVPDLTRITRDSVGPLLETWNTLNVYCEVYQIDSFTFDDYIEALEFKSEDDHFYPELLVEIHCSVLKKLVNDVNDKNGMVQVSLPELAEIESEEESNGETSTVPTPAPESEFKRTTRGSLAKSEAAEILANAAPPPIDAKLHRAAELDHSLGTYDWKMRLRQRDFIQGRWIVIIVGLLNQLSGNVKLKSTCDEVLAHLAPLDEEPTESTVIAQYAVLNINMRVKILQMLCMLSLETKTIRNYMEECNESMTVYRKERITEQRNRKAAMEKLRLLHEERRALQPESKSITPLPEVQEREDSKVDIVEDEIAEEIADEDELMDSEDEEPVRGRSLRRANDRALQRKKKQEEEKERKAKAEAEKAKKPTKQAKQLEKVLKKIEDTKDEIKRLEEEVARIENDLREADCPRTRVLGKDRFWNRYYWFERNAMPYAGLPDASTAAAKYANGRLWIQGPDDLERNGFIELPASENEHYRRAFGMNVPERKVKEEGPTHTFTAYQWGYYDDPEQLDALIAWLDNRGVREVKLRKELQNQREKISRHMENRKQYLAENDDRKSESGEPVTMISTRHKTYANPTGVRCLSWHNNMAKEQIGQLHSDPRSTNKKAQKAAKKVIEEEGRQTRASNRPGKQLTRQGSRYDF